MMEEKDKDAPARQTGAVCDCCDELIAFMQVQHMFKVGQCFLCCCGEVTYISTSDTVGGQLELDVNRLHVMRMLVESLSVAFHFTPPVLCRLKTCIIVAFI